VRHCHHSSASAEGSNVALGGVGPRCISISWDVETLVRGSVYRGGAPRVIHKAYHTPETISDICSSLDRSAVSHTPPIYLQQQMAVTVGLLPEFDSQQVAHESLVDGEELMRRFEKFVQAVTQRTMVEVLQQPKV
jgi:hypothetical protein